MYMRKIEQNLFYLGIVLFAGAVPNRYFMGVVLVMFIIFLIGWYYDAKFDKNFVNPIDSVHLELISRYLVITEVTKVDEHITNMLLHLQENIKKFPTDKTSRWIGYIQRYMIEVGAVTVQSERDFSRPLFHSAYKKLGYTIPESTKIK